MGIQLKSLVLVLAFSIAPAAVSQAPSTPGCTVKKGYYHCDRDNFLAALKAAKNIAVESKPTDTATKESMGRLVRSLDKKETSGSADLTFVLIRSQFEGIFYGPSDRELASLLVYSGSAQGPDRKLIWIETFDGQPDLVWPIVVFDILKQFKAGIA